MAVNCPLLKGNHVLNAHFITAARASYNTLAMPSLCCSFNNILNPFRCCWPQKKSPLSFTLFPSSVQCMKVFQFDHTLFITASHWILWLCFKILNLSPLSVKLSLQFSFSLAAFVRTAQKSMFDSSLQRGTTSGPKHLLCNTVLP